MQVGVAEIAILSLYLASLPAVNGTPPYHCPASCDTSLVVSGGVDSGRRPRNVYDKKPQRYAKDNRTAQ